MKLKDPLRTLTLISIALSLELAIVSGGLPSAQAQSSSSGLQTLVNFEPPSDNLEPDSSIGGASRNGGICSQDATTASLSASIPRPLPVISLLPLGNHGLTTSKRPTFFVYLPHSSARQVLFSMEDEYENYHYHAKLPITGAPGIISFSVPTTAPILEMGKDYRWSVALVCGAELDPGDPKVEGWVQRIEPNTALKLELEDAAPLEQAVLYASAGIWYDTLSTLAELKQDNPNDSQLGIEWTELLKSVGLEQIASAPLVE